MELWDTAGQEDYDRIRPLSYPDADVILMCFSVDCPESLESVYEKWDMELKHYCPGVPVILVGNKKDLRYNATVLKTLAMKNKSPVLTEEGKIIAEKINAFEYVECSARTKEGVNKVFEVATRAALQVGTCIR